jgi:hypothetical protein
VLDDLKDTNGLRREVWELDDGDQWLIRWPQCPWVRDVSRHETGPETLGCILIPLHTRDVCKVTFIHDITTLQLIPKEGFGIRPIPFEHTEEHDHWDVRVYIRDLD